MVSVHGKRVYMFVGYHKKFVEVDGQSVFSGLIWGCLPKSWWLGTDKLTNIFKKGVLFWKTKNLKV